MGDMLKISAPKSVSRGGEFKGIIEVTENELKNARTVEVILHNTITYGKTKENLYY